ncbi:MAG: metalloregulator ArsR/SmtB family transcription factor [Desulfocapsaceae bacterium]|nr:metalloregulator ArsR/SmtB family transcription factor [Desulfocapsaceae bacterium]
MKNFIKVMKALSDPNRVKIIKMLQQRENMCVCEMRAMLNLAQPTVSNHLKILEEAGLIVFEKEKLWVNYRLHPAGESLYSAAMLAQLENWLNETPEITEIHRLLPTINRNDICKL